MDFGIFMEFEIRAYDQPGAFQKGFRLVDAATEETFPGAREPAWRIGSKRASTASGG